MGSNLPSSKSTDWLLRRRNNSLLSQCRAGLECARGTGHSHTASRSGASRLPQELSSHCIPICSFQLRYNVYWNDSEF